MMEDTAIAALQRTLGEYREAKRKIQIRLAELEAEAEMLRSQLAMFNEIIERTEQDLRRVLFRDEIQPGRPTQPTPGASHRPGRSLFPEQDRFYDAASEAAIEAEVEKIQRTEQGGNVRFTDFRIPQAATVILREANGPLHVSEIYRRMAEGGFEFRGQHQLITLAVSLSRSKRFRKVAPGTFQINPDYQAGQVA